MGKIASGRGNARNSAQKKKNFFVTTMLQSRDHPPPGAKYNKQNFERIPVEHFSGWL